MKQLIIPCLRCHLNRSLHFLNGAASYSVLLFDLYPDTNVWKKKGFLFCFVFIQPCVLLIDVISHSLASFLPSFSKADRHVSRKTLIVSLTYITE